MVKDYYWSIPHHCGYSIPNVLDREKNGQRLLLDHTTPLWVLYSKRFGYREEWSKTITGAYHTTVDTLFQTFWIESRMVNVHGWSIPHHCGYSVSDVLDREHNGQSSWLEHTTPLWVLRSKRYG
jgi:hypothetical protein